ncbi:dienelactone hydrolase family protein [Streptomyces sp. NPDC020807]|uniref:dienelactone hydrolase family protein n=1 Tax=Streptomyces sp. NPDC020807 TaxID=3155119 RepID=UPI0033E62B65
MAEVLLFHHALGLTDGVVALADELRRAGHTVHTPDLFDGETFDDLEVGVAYAQEVGFDVLAERGVAAADGLPKELVYAGISLGVVPAQRLAQTRPGALGVLLLSGCVPEDAFGPAWPEGVPVQVHAMDADPFFVDDGDLDAARALVAGAEDRALFLYPGAEHLFVERGSASFVPDASEASFARIRDFLGGLAG